MSTRRRKLYDTSSRNDKEPAKETLLREARERLFREKETTKYGTFSENMLKCYDMSQAHSFQ